MVYFSTLGNEFLRDFRLHGAFLAYSYLRVLQNRCIRGVFNDNHTESALDEKLSKNLSRISGAEETQFDSIIELII